MGGRADMATLGATGRLFPQRSKVGPCAGSRTPATMTNQTARRAKNAKVRNRGIGTAVVPRVWGFPRGQDASPAPIISPLGKLARLSRGAASYRASDLLPWSVGCL